MVLPARSPLDDDRTVPCRTHDPEIWFPKPGQAGAKTRALAVRLCKEECPRREACLARALARGDVEHGILGGLTPPERRALLRPAAPAVADLPRPLPPPRYMRRYGGHEPDPDAARDRYANLFDAARAFLEGEGTRVVVAARFGVSEPRMAQAAAILRWCPDLEADVVEGWVSGRHVHDHAQLVKQWTQARDGAGDMGVAA